MEEKKDIEALLRAGNTVKFHPSGGSMAPFFSSPDDYAVVEPLTEKIRPLDVLVYRRQDGPLIIHRVCKIKPEGLYMVGDAQVVPEGPLSDDCVAGVMVSYIKNGRERSVRYFPYRFYSAIWMLLRPFRGIIFDIGHGFKVFIKKITGRK